jgi:hypothetical protein
MKRTLFLVSALVTGSFAAAAGLAIAAQDRFALSVPNGPAFSEFRGYDTWAYISVSHTEDGQKIIAGNPAMIEAYRSGAPGNGKPVPDGAKMVKIEWSEKKMAESPYFVMEPDTLRSVSFMEKDANRFKSSGGWGYAQFKYDAAAASFTPTGSGAGCGFACHTVVKAKDYVFTPYPRR